MIGADGYTSGIAPADASLARNSCFTIRKYQTMSIAEDKWLGIFYFCGEMFRASTSRNFCDVLRVLRKS